MDKVLVLNNDFTPINVTSLRRGFKLVFKGKAEIIYSDDDNPITSSFKKFQRPSVIRLIKYIYFPYRKVPLSRINVFKRDGNRCVYCGTVENLTIDHVLPKSRGGNNHWKNIVTCCKTCNVYKDSMTPDEAGLTMSHEPFVPTYLQFIEKMDGLIDDKWKTFLIKK